MSFSKSSYQTLITLWPWKLTKHSDLYQTMVTIHVGPDSYPFHTYKELLCNDSSFFKTTFESKSSTREGAKQAVTLPNYGVEVFKIYQSWLNTMQVRYNFDDGENWWVRFVKLWTFADNIGSTTLKNTIAEAIQATICQNSSIRCPSPKIVTYTYDQTSDDSPLRELLVRMFLHRSYCYEPKLEDYPADFVRKLAGFLLTHARNCSRYCGRAKGYTEEIPFTVIHRDCTSKCCKEGPW